MSDWEIALTIWLTVVGSDIVWAVVQTRMARILGVPDGHLYLTDGDAIGFCIFLQIVLPPVAWAFLIPDPPGPYPTERDGGLSS